MSSFQADFRGNLDQVENSLVECDALERVLSSYVAFEAARNRRRGRRGRGRIHGHDVRLWALVLRAVAMGAERDGVVEKATVKAFTAYLRDLNPRQLRALVRRLHDEGLREAGDLPSAA